jgi:hypothetical protein
MSISAAARRVLHLVINDFPAGKLEEIGAASPDEIVRLTESNSREALEKIFAADTIAVWIDPTV